MSGERKQMQEKEYVLSGGSLYYEKYPNKIVITRFHGLAGEVHIPEEIDGLPVRELAKKAFLSKKQLRRVFLPDTIEELGDWAFAYCDGLEQVIFPHKAIYFGKAVFLECNSLKGLFKQKDEIWNGEVVATLLAAAVTSMQAYYLLDIMEAGSEEWLAKWDARMLELLARPDEEGFSRQVLCGEEDYGSTDMNMYVQEKRKGKVRLLLLRCLYPVGLSEENKQTIEQYLREHTKGCNTDETWQVVLQEHGTDRAYYELYAQLGGVTEDNLEKLLADIGEDYPEMKAYFLRYKEMNIGYSDFFEDLEL